MSPRLLGAYALLLCLSASQAIPTFTTMTTRPQTRDEMCATLLRGMQRIAEMHGGRVGEPSLESIATCYRMIDDYLTQSQHPLRLKYGMNLEIMNQDQIRALYSEVAGTPWENVSLHETPFQDIAFYLGRSGPWFPPVEQIAGKAGSPFAGLVALLISIVTLGGFLTLRRTTSSKREDRVGGVLDFYAGLCPNADTRFDVEACAADLRRDVRKWRSLGWSSIKVWFARGTRTFMTILIISGTGLVRGARAIMSVVRDIIPPRAG